MENDKNKIRKIIKTTLKEFLNEQQECSINIDDIFNFCKKQINYYDILRNKKTDFTIGMIHLYQYVLNNFNNSKEIIDYCKSVISEKDLYKDEEVGMRDAAISILDRFDVSY